MKNIQIFFNKKNTYGLKWKISSFALSTHLRLPPSISASVDGISVPLEFRAYNLLQILGFNSNSGAKRSLDKWKILQWSPLGLDDNFGKYWDLVIVVCLMRDYSANFPLYNNSCTLNEVAEIFLGTQHLEL